MNKTAIIVTIISSLLSGIIGTIISTHFYSKLEKKKLKIETARKLFANKSNTQSKEFSSAINEAIFVFSDNQKVVQSIEELWLIATTPMDKRTEQQMRVPLIKVIKAICEDVGIDTKNIPEEHYLRYISFAP